MTRTALLALGMLVLLLGAAAYGLREWAPSPPAEVAKPAAPSRVAGTAVPANAPPPAMTPPPQQQSAPAASTTPGSPSAREPALPGPKSDPVGRPAAAPPAGLAIAPPREAPPAPSTPGAAPSEGPSFDVVRIGPDGAIVVAGRGTPGSSVALMSGDREIGRAAVDNNGEWVLALPDSGLPAGAHGLILRQHASGQTPRDSSRTVMVHIPDRPARVAVVRPAPASEAAPAAPAPAPAPPQSQPLVVSAPTSGAGPVAVLQAPAAPPRAGDLTVATVDYDENGRVAASGNAVPGSVVRMYLDDVFVGETIAAIDGKWRILASQPAEPGPHRLRIDRLDPRGMVVGRLELPFVRQLPPPSMAQSSPSITIVRGDNLWNIARARYGDGFQYVVIYEANRSFIRDPNLIYPGQVFRMPER